MSTAPSRPDAHDQAAAIKSGKVESDHFVRAAVAAIKSEDPEINAIAHERFGEALREAAEVDRDAPFAGVPILVKDLMCPVAGLPLSNGNGLLKAEEHVAATSSVLVDRMRQAGFIVLGSTTTAEFGATITTETSAFGPCRNPRALDLSSGGSSGGSAAAVAAGFVPLAHGNDASGSLRIPAAFCGVLGYKPAPGRIDDGGDPSSWFGLAAQGPIAATVRDLRALTTVLAGGTSVTPEAPTPTVPRVGVLDIDTLDGLDPGVRDGVRFASDALESTGDYEVVRLRPDRSPLLDPDFGRHFSLVAATAVAAEVQRAEQETSGDLRASLDPPTAALVRLAERRTALDLARSHAWLIEFRSAMKQWWSEAGLHVLLTPVVTSLPPQLGALADPETGGRLVAKIMRFTAQFNVTGQPALSVPAGGDGPVPVGVQLVAGSSSDEDFLFRAAEVLTEARDVCGTSHAR